MSKRNKRGYVQRSSTEISDIISAYRSSGLEARSFCKEHNIPLGTFYSWLQKSSSNKAKKGEPASFIQLTPSIKTPPSSVRSCQSLVLRFNFFSILSLNYQMTKSK